MQGNESTDTAGMLVAHSLKVSLAEAGAAADNKPRTATASLGAGAPAAVADDNDSNDAMDNDDVAVQESMQDQETTETAEARNSDDGAEGSEVGGLLARSPEQAAKKPKRNALQLVQKAARRVQAEADDRIEVGVDLSAGIRSLACLCATSTIQLTVPWLLLLHRRR